MPRLEFNGGDFATLTTFSGASMGMGAYPNTPQFNEIAGGLVFSGVLALGCASVGEFKNGYVETVITDATAGAMSAGIFARTQTFAVSGQYMFTRVHTFLNQVLSVVSGAGFLPSPGGVGTRYRLRLEAIEGVVTATATNLVTNITASVTENIGLLSVGKWGIFSESNFTAYSNIFEYLEWEDYDGVVGVANATLPALGGAATATATGEARTLGDGIYKQFTREIAPPWLRLPNGEAWNTAHGELKDQAVNAVLNLVKLRLAGLADEEALGLIGSDRNLERYPNEQLEAWRVRVLGAWEFWQKGGTVAGVVLALAQMGYTASVLELRNVNAAQWSEFVVIINPNNGSNLWGQPVGALWGEPTGATWGGGLTLDELTRIRRILRKVKPAHTWIPQLYIRSQGDLWGEGGGLWGEPAGALWENSDLTVIDGIQGVE